MGRKKKTPAASAPPTAPAPKAAPTKAAAKQPLRRSARRANGLPEDNPNGCLNTVDPEEEDSQHSEGRGFSLSKDECASGKEPLMPDLPPSTVVHKKFGMITCMPHGSPLDEVISEPALQAPQVVQAVPYSRRRTRGSSIQDAQRMVEMVLAQEGEELHLQEENETCESGSLEQGLHVPSPDTNLLDQEVGIQEAVVEEEAVVQGEAGEEESVMYTDSVMVQEVDDSWHQENSNSNDVDSESAKPKGQDLQRLLIEAEMDKAARMDTETESQDSEDTPMPVLEKEHVPTMPLEESDSQASSNDTSNSGRRRSRRHEPKLVPSVISHAETIIQSDVSSKYSDEDQTRLEAADEKMPSEETEEMAPSTKPSSKSSPFKAGLDNLNNGRPQSLTETKVEGSMHSVEQLGESMAEMDFNQKSRDASPVPLSSNTGHSKEFFSNLDSSVCRGTLGLLSQVKTPEKNDLRDLFQPRDEKIPFLSPVKTSNDLSESANIPAGKEKPTSRRQKSQTATSKTRTKSATRLHEEKEVKKKPGRGRKSSSDAPSLTKNGDGKSAGVPAEVSTPEPSAPETPASSGRSRRPRNGRKAAHAAGAPEPKAAMEAPDAGGLHALTAMVPPSVPHNVHDPSMPVKVKSRWRRSSELEMGGGFPFPEELPVPAHTIPSPGRELPSAPEKAKVETKCEENHVKQETVSTGSPPQPEVEDGSTPMDVEVEPSDKSDKAAPEVEGPAVDKKEDKEASDHKTEVDIQNDEKLRNFQVLDENEYRTER